MFSDVIEELLFRFYALINSHTGLREKYSKLGLYSRTYVHSAESLWTFAVIVLEEFGVTCAVLPPLPTIFKNIIIFSFITEYPLLYSRVQVRPSPEAS